METLTGQIYVTILSNESVVCHMSSRILQSILVEFHTKLKGFSINLTNNAMSNSTRLVACYNHADETADKCYCVTSKLFRTYITYYFVGKSVIKCEITIQVKENNESKTKLALTFLKKNVHFSLFNQAIITWYVQGEAQFLSGIPKLIRSNMIYNKA